MHAPFDVIMPKVTTKEKRKLAFGYWDDEKGSCWSLVEVGNSSNWHPRCSQKQHYAELRQLKAEGLEKVNVIVGFFEGYETDEEKEQLIKITLRRNRPKLLRN